MPRKESMNAPISAQAQQEAASDGIDSYELPKSLVTRIAKSAIPENSKLQKDTVTALVKGSTVFINFLAATAHDVAISKQHKSVSASDVLKALENIQFGDMVGELEEELKVFRELNKRKSGKGDASARGKGKGKATAATNKDKDKGTTAPAMAGSTSISTATSDPSGSRAAKSGDGDEEMVDVDDADELESAGEEEEDQLEYDVDEPEPEGEGEVDVEQEDGDEVEEEVESEGEVDEQPDRMALDEEDLAEDKKRAKLGPGTESRA